MLNTVTPFMKRLPEIQDMVFVHPQSIQIWEQIIYSMDQYTHDSSLSKFYPTDQIIRYCNSIATVLVQQSYSPIPSYKSATKTKLCELFNLTILCGIQMYIKEQAITYGFRPYKAYADDTIFREVKNRVGKKLIEGITVEAPISEIMQKIITDLTHEFYFTLFTLKGKELNIERLQNLLPVSVMWGYLSAKELISYS